MTATALLLLSIAVHGQVVTQSLPAIGPTAGGTNVTVRGSGFDGVTSVSFGTASAITFAVGNTGSLNALSPPAPAGTCSITVTTTAGSSSPSPGSSYLYLTNSDTTAAVYWADDREPACLAMINSATASITIASWQLSDSRVALALQAKGSSIPVKLVEQFSGTNSVAYQLASNNVAQTGEVYWAHVPRTLDNNFIAVDGRKAILGNYYLSPSAVQIGSYAMQVSGTSSPAAAAAEYSALIIAGTAVLPPEMILARPFGLAVPKLSTPNKETPPARPRNHNRWRRRILYEGLYTGSRRPASPRRAAMADSAARKVGKLHLLSVGKVDYSNRPRDRRPSPYTSYV